MKKKLLQLSLILFLIMKAGLKAYPCSNDVRYSVYANLYNEEVMMLDNNQYPIGKRLPSKDTISCTVVKSPAYPISKKTFMYTILGAATHHVRIARDEIYAQWSYAGYIQEVNGKFVSK